MTEEGSHGGTKHTGIATARVVASREKTKMVMLMPKKAR
jgi:hypothetical protein